MNRRFALIFALAVVVMGIVPAIGFAAEISVGVKQGDWIEYQVSYTGTPDPSHAISWARMEIASIQGQEINLEMTTRFSNGTQLNETATLNLMIGQLGDDFIIPANLNTGDTFFDKNADNITISGTEKRTFAGATRTVVYGSTHNTMFYWDKSTGVVVEGKSTCAEYTLTTIATRTNMWQSQVFGLDPVVFYVLSIVVVAILVAITILVIRRKK